MSGEEHRTAAQLFESVNSRDCVMQNIGSSIATWARIIVSGDSISSYQRRPSRTSPTPFHACWFREDLTDRHFRHSPPKPFLAKAKRCTESQFPNSLFRKAKGDVRVCRGKNNEEQTKKSLNHNNTNARVFWASIPGTLMIQMSSEQPATGDGLPARASLPEFLKFPMDLGNLIHLV